MVVHGILYSVLVRLSKGAILEIGMVSKIIRDVENSDTKRNKIARNCLSQRRYKYKKKFITHATCYR